MRLPKLVRKLLVAIVAVFFFGGCAPLLLAQEDSELADRLLSVVNRMRAEAGARPVKPDPRLRYSARLHLEQFAGKSEFSDQYPGEPSLRQRLSKADVLCVDVGEIYVRLPDIGTDIEDEEKRAEEALRTESTLKTILASKYSVADFAVVRRGMTIYAVGNFISPLRVLSTDVAEELFLEALQKARKQLGLSPFSLIPFAKLRKASCEMARKDSLASGIAIQHSDLLGNEQSGYTYAFTTGNPEDISSAPEIASLIHARTRKVDLIDRRTISLGACLATSKSYPNGVYWFIVTLYDY